MTAALYVRVSTDEQSVAGQLAELRRYAAAYGWTTVDFIDHGVSGHLQSRPALDKLLEAVRNDEIQVVLCWRLDRLGRSLRHVVGLVDDFRKAGARLVTMEGFDTSLDYSAILLGVLAGFAESESRRISARCRLNIAARRVAGKPVGRGKTLDLRPERLEGVKGLSVRQAAKALGVSVGSMHNARKAAA